MTRPNLERGFRRITAILSLAILIPGVLFALFWWSGERKAWTDALKQPDTKYQVVWAIGKGEFEFGRQKSETEIAKLLEEVRTGWSLEEIMANAPRKAEASRKGLTLEQLPKYETFDITPPPVSFIYRPTTPDRPGHLYSVKELLEGRHAGTLPVDVKETIDKLGAEKPSRLPWKSWTTKPVVFGAPGLAGALGLATGLAAVPWAVFFLLRWVFRGFAPDTIERP